MVQGLRLGEGFGVRVRLNVNFWDLVFTRLSSYSVMVSRCFC